MALHLNKRPVIPFQFCKGRSHRAFAVPRHATASDHYANEHSPCRDPDRRSGFTSSGAGSGRSRWLASHGRDASGRRRRRPLARHAGRHGLGGHPVQWAEDAGRFGRARTVSWPHARRGHAHARSILSRSARRHRRAHAGSTGTGLADGQPWRDGARSCRNGDAPGDGDGGPKHGTWRNARSEWRRQDAKLRARPDGTRRGTPDAAGHAAESTTPAAGLGAAGLPAIRFFFALPTARPARGC